MKHWTEKAERGSTCLLRLVSWLARTVGRPFCRLLLYPIVLYFIIFDRTARQASTEFLYVVRHQAVRWFDVFAHFHHFASTLLDRVYLSRGEFHRFHITIENQELVDQVLSEGRGCVLLGSHLGNFDLVALAASVFATPLPLNIMMRVDPRSRLRHIAGIDDTILNIIPLGRPDSFLKAYEAVTQGGIVAALADRAERDAYVTIDFLNRKTKMPIAPHQLAARCKAPVLLFFGLYEGGNSYRIKFIDAGLRAPPSSRNMDLAPTIQKYAAVLERQALKYPLNWFNFYPYWNQ